MTEWGLAETRGWLYRFTEGFERQLADPTPHSDFWRREFLEGAADFVLDLRRQADDYTGIASVVPVWEAQRGAAVAAGEADPAQIPRSDADLATARLRLARAEAELDALRLSARARTDEWQQTARRLLAIRDGIDEYTKLSDFILDWRLLNAERQRERAESSREQEARVAS